MDRLIAEYSDEQSGLSRYWRKNISYSEALELANVLRALKKVAGYTGRNVGCIEWAGMSQNEKGSIILDPGMVLGKYPVPFCKFDYMAGIVQAHALHQPDLGGGICLSGIHTQPTC